MRMNRFIRNRQYRQAIVYALLAALLVLWTGGAVAHYCFDGREPPITVHFDSLMGHTSHSSEEGHVDVEKSALPVNLITKIFELDTGLIPYVLLLLSLLRPVGAPVYVPEQTERPHSLRSLIPPLRAPPVYSC